MPYDEVITLHMKGEFDINVLVTETSHAPNERLYYVDIPQSVSFSTETLQQIKSYAIQEFHMNRLEERAQVQLDNLKEETTVNEKEKAA
jgi:hypothetical protein